MEHNMKINILIFLPLLVLLSCSTDSMKLVNYEPREYKVNKDYIKKIKVKENIKLQESKEVILKNITDVDLSKNKLFILDAASSKLVRYNLDNGKIINHFTPSLKLSDSLALSGLEPSYYTAYKDRILKYETIQKGKEIMNRRGYDSSNYSKMMANGVYSFTIYNGYLYLSAVIRTGLYSVDSLPILQTEGNRCCILQLDTSLKLRNVRPTQRNHKEGNKDDLVRKFPSGYDFGISNDNIYLAARNCFYDNNKHEDPGPMTSALKFDMNARELGIIDYLPDDYVSSGQGYQIYYSPFFTSVKNEPYVAYPYGTRIKNLETQSEFELTNLPLTNRAGWDYLIRRENGFSLFTEQKISFSNKINLLPIRIWNLLRKGDNILVVLAIIRENENKMKKCDYQYWVQEYTTDGELVAYGAIPEETKSGVIQTVAYDNYNQQFLIFRKSHSGFTMEKAIWE